jgi:hypothetical protein
VALGDESRALLQLLLARGKDYGQIATLLGIEPEEVRSRAERAIGELEEGGGALEPIVIDYLLGQADPIGRAEAVRELSDNPEESDRFAQVKDQLDLLFPGADIPTPPRSSGSGQAVPKKRAKIPPPPAWGSVAPQSSQEAEGTNAGRFGGMDAKSRTILAALVAAVGLAAIVVVVILLGGGGAEQNVVEEPPPPTTAVLRPAGGGEGRGEVEFGFAGSRFAANVSLSSLEPNPDEEGYALWLEGPAGSFPFDSARVGPEGTIAGQSEISQAIICFIAADLFTEVKVSRVGDAELTEALRRAVDRNVRQADFPDYVGETVLSGPISMPLETKERIIEVCGGRTPTSGADSPGS